jgi:hypothetical protein
MMLATLRPLPAEAPIDGPFWTHVVPVLLFGVALAATLMLYRHFSGRDDR